MILRCNACKRPYGWPMCEPCKAERRRLAELHRWFERQVCEADMLGKQKRLAELLGEQAMRPTKYAARMKGPDELHSEAEARIVAETMGGEVAFGRSGLLLYAADLAFLARVKAALKKKKKSA